MNISNKLFNITDRKKNSNKEIFHNLKNCLLGKRACIFSCGPNLHEHKHRFNEIENDSTLIKCCWKSSIKIVKCDILGIGNYMNNLSGINIPSNTFTVNFRLSFTNKILENDNKKLEDKNILTIKSKRFNKHVYKKNSFWRWDDITIDFKNNEIIQEEYIDCTYNFIDFLLYLGIKEFYLFGFHHSDKMIDLHNYNYEQLLRKKHHYYNTVKSNNFCINALEPADWNSIICSYYLPYIMEKNNAKCYNVSSLGIVSNRIKRITFDSIFTDRKEYIQPENKYIDLIDQLNNIVDFEYYYKKYIKDNHSGEDIKLEVYTDIILEGIYCKKQFNTKNENKNEIDINNFSISIFCSVCFIKNYPLLKNINRKQIHIFFCHFANEFNHKVVNIYNKEVFNEKYFDSLLEKYSEELSIFKIDYNQFVNKQFIHHFFNFKYFKLLIWLYSENSVTK
jgi:hypothetical protein